MDPLASVLNPQQLEAVRHGDGPLLILAGAGSGKTRVLTHRIAHLLREKLARPAEVLAVTFTNKAAGELRDRVAKLVGPEAERLWVATFHAAGARLLRREAESLSLPRTFAIYDEGDALAETKRACQDLGVDVGTARQHLSRIDRWKNLGVLPPSVQVPEWDVPGKQAIRVYDRYQKALQAGGAVDFGDLIVRVIELFAKHPEIEERYASRFRYILVDEFQDTNRTQSELVSVLAEPDRNLTVVGDDDQSIYRFRGAAISNILGFRDRYPTARTIVLRRNYRSRPGILEAAQRLVAFNDPDRLEVRAGISKRLTAERSSVGTAQPVRLELHPSAGDEADRIATEIAARVGSGTAPRDIAVLVRANGHADGIIRSLEAAGVRWRFSGSAGLYARPEVRRLLAFLRAIADLGSSVDLYAVATAEPYHLGGEDLTAIVTTARRRNRTIWDVLEELDRQPGILRVSAETRATVRRLVEDLRALSQLAHERPAAEVVYGFLRRTGTLTRLAADPSFAAEETLRNIARFFEIVRSQSALLADDRATFVAGHLQTLIDAGDDPATAELDPDANAVAVLTVHKAKGLEFPIVYVPGLVAGRFPTPNRRDPLSMPPELVGEDPDADDNAQLREERRLFYVAITRARDELVLSYAADYGGLGPRRVSPFVLEALDLPPTDRDGAARAATAMERIEAAGTPRPSEAVVSPRSDVEPLTLSFSAIDAYLSCPLKYKLGHVVRVPTPPHHALIYGSALHRAVQEFHRRHARGDVMTEQELDAALDSTWTNEGFVSREHEEARLAAARQTLRRFRAAQLQPDAVVPAYVEREFSFSLGGDRIRGRWDRVDIEQVGDDGPPGSRDSAAAGVPHADTVAPTLELTGHERVTITDYKTSDVRDVRKAHQRARDSLQLQIYAMAYEAVSGRLPDALQLHFLDTGVTGRASVDQRRLSRAKERIGTVAAGIRARDFTAKPDRSTCGYCPFRSVCPSSVAT
ncbi:MAG: ATP-dependent helicase [Myxococcales bacterium]